MRIDPFEPVPTDAPATGGATYVGPLDRGDWPDRLVAHVVSPDPDARLHGYDVAGDLAHHTSLAEVAWLTLRGELPSPSERAAFEAALILLAPVHIGQAPTHAAFLSGIAGALPNATVTIGAVGLGELARHERIALAPWLAWLAAGDATAPVPAVAVAVDPTPAARAAHAALDRRMRAWFGADRGLPSTIVHRVAGAHALLHRLGLHGALVVEALAVWARLPAVVAEAAFARAGAIRTYPADLPAFQYVDDRGATR